MFQFTSFTMLLLPKNATKEYFDNVFNEGSVPIYADSRSEQFTEAKSSAKKEFDVEIHALLYTVTYKENQYEC